MPSISGRIKAFNLSQLPQSVLGKASSLSTRLRLIYNGPVKNNLMVGREFVSLVAKEQQLHLLPKAEQWAEAKQTYQLLLQRILPQGELTISQTLQRLGDLTWSEVSSGTKVLIHLSALFYLSQLAGKTIAYPLSYFKRA